MKALPTFLLLTTLLAAATPKHEHQELVPVTIRPARDVTVGERSVVDIYVAPLLNTIIALPPKEIVRDITTGDSSDFQVKKTSDKTRYVTVKIASESMVATTVNIVSDHDKVYTFRLVPSTAEADSKVFVDPDSQLSADLDKPSEWVQRSEAESWKTKAETAQAAAEKAQKDVDTKIDAGIDAFKAKYPGMLHFDYEWNREKGRKFGIEAAFRDQTFTYLRTHAQDAPALYETKEGKPSLITFDFHDGLYRIPRTLDRFYLTIGKTRVDFTRDVTRDVN